MFYGAGRLAIDTLRRGFRNRAGQFIFCSHEVSGDAVGIRNTHGMKSFKFSAEGEKERGRESFLIVQPQNLSNALAHSDLFLAPHL
jgi:hypothetical protein